MAGHIEKRTTKTGEKVWYVRVFLGRDPQTGKVIRHGKHIHGTKKDAQRYLNGILAEKDLGRFSAPSKDTLGAFLDRWIEAKRGTVRDRTLRSYEVNIASYLKPELGKCRLDQLDHIQIQQAYGRLQARGLGPTTVRRAHVTLHQALKHAVKWRLIAYNPATDLDLPRMQRKEKVVLTPEQARAFIAAAVEDRLGVPLIFAITTGLRPSELLGLRWSDIDIDAGLASVRQVLVDDLPAAQWYFAEPKTSKSRRTVALPDALPPLLRLHQERQEQERREAGSHWVDRGLAFCGRRGQPLERRNLTNRHLRPILKACGITEPMNLYTLRHSCATLLFAAGEHPKVVSERLGHAGVAITLDVYSHVIPGMQRQAAARLDRMLFPGEVASGDPNRTP